MYGGVILLFSLATILFFQNVQTDPVDQTNPPQSKPRTAPGDWNSSRVPDPGAEVPIMAIRPEDLGVFPPTSPLDHPARITRAISENDLPAIHSTTLSWFEHDPAAARDWLAEQPTLEDLQPAISHIAHRIADGGHIEYALQWAALLTDDRLHDDTVFDIHALALRNGRITTAEITHDRIPPERIKELLGGAAGD